MIKCRATTHADHPTLVMVWEIRLSSVERHLSERPMPSAAADLPRWFISFGRHVLRVCKKPGTYPTTSASDLLVRPRPILFTPTHLNP
jgi:hypothetical protein